MERIGGKLGDLKVRAENAQEKFEADKATLYRGDGSQLYSDDEHKERLGAFTRERNEVLKQVEEDVRAERVSLEEKIAHIKNRDAAELLSGEELRSANDRRAFALDAVQTLGAEELVGRLRSVLATGDKGAIFAYLNAGERKRRELANSRPGTPGAASSGELGSVLAEMRKALDPEAEAEITAAKERQEQSIQVELLAGNLKYGVRDSVSAYLARAYADVPERVGLKRR